MNDTEICDLRHKSLDDCITRIKKDIKSIETDSDNIHDRLTILEGDVNRNKKDIKDHKDEIKSMKTLQISILVGIIMILAAEIFRLV